MLVNGQALTPPRADSAREFANIAGHRRSRSADHQKRLSAVGEIIVPTNGKAIVARFPRRTNFPLAFASNKPNAPPGIAGRGC